MTATVTNVDPKDFGGFQFPVVVAYLVGDLDNTSAPPSIDIPMILVEGLVQDVVLDSHGNTYPLDAVPDEAPDRH